MSSIDAIERDAVEQQLHVGQRVDGHALPADLAAGQGVVAVPTHQRREVESN